MFLQAAHLGRKDVECMICWGHQHGLLCLDPQPDVSAIQAVRPQTSREEIGDLYYQVYKLQRLPGSPPCGPEQMEELAGDVVSSLKDCLRQKGAQLPRGPEESELAATQPLQSETPRRRRRDISAKRDLAKAREAHQRALAAAATLEERIERLSQSVTRGWPGICAQSWSCNCQRRRSWGQNRRHCRVLPEDSPVHSPEHSPPRRAQEPGKTKGLNCLFWSSTWSHHQSWHQMLTAFSRSWPAAWGKEVELIHPQNPQQKNMKSGSPGGGRCSICLNGGRSWQRFQK